MLLSCLLAGSQVRAQSAGGALDYAGGINEATGDFTTLPADVVESLSGEFTIEAWVLWRGGTMYQRIFDFGNDINNYMFLTPASETGNIKFGIVIGNVPQVLESTVPFPANTWNHIAVSVDNTNTARLFLNGTVVGTSGTGAITFKPSQLDHTTATNWLGQSRYHPPLYGDAYFNGQIDEFRISNTARYIASFPRPTGQFATDANTVALYHFNETSGQTVLDATTAARDGFLGSTTAADGNDPTRITNSILPVTFHNFSFQKTGNSVDLKWKASNTNGGGQFVIERSLDGKTFQSIGKVSISNLAGTYSYSFSDQSLSGGKNFYRIRAEETNSSVKYSQIILVDMDDLKSFAIYPTNATTQLFVKVPKSTNIAIYNNQGALVRKMQIEASQHIDVADLIKGVYQIRFEGAKESLRFIKL
jgi:hypothetical protein